MSIIGIELQERRTDGLDRYDYSVEEEADFLTDPVLTERSGVGSMAWCWELMAPCVKFSDGWYKKSDGAMVKIVAASESEET